MSSLRQNIVVLLLMILMAPAGWAATGQAVQDRIDSDIAAGKPIVIHVVVALCDNINQGIVPVPTAIAYDQYQKCGLRGAKRLFWGMP